jgi:selenocysteine lyase/cysteine desulfurase
MGAASNAVGTLNPVAEVARLARRAGARLFVDAVHHAPHAPMDVEAWEADFVVCSAYKFFGPRGVGALWARPGALDELPAFKLRPATDALPGRWESGAMCHEGIVGTSAAVDYLADQGRGPTAHDRRSLLLLAFEKIAAHERSLAARMLAGLRALSAWRVWGIADPARVVERVPTISVTHRRMAPREAAEKLAERGIFAWHGNHYALPVTEELGLEPGGTLRLGLLHYNTVDEVERVLEELESIG